MECIRLGARTGGRNIGCCAVDVFQGFDTDPNALIPETVKQQMFQGDRGEPLLKDGHTVFLGPTYRDAFLQRLVYSTFDLRPLPDHIFIACMADRQVTGHFGKQWLALLKEHGFEYVRTVSNSVYTHSSVPPNSDDPSVYQHQYPHPLHMFMLVRNISASRVPNTFAPPESWQALANPTTTPEERWHNLVANMPPLVLGPKFESNKDKAFAHAPKPVLKIGG